MRFLILIWLISIAFEPALAEEKTETDFNQLGKRGYALWECAAYGSLAGIEHPLAMRFFDEGHETLSAFVTAWKAGKLTKENTKEVPVGISWWLSSGPTVEFSMGYMWAQFTDHVHKETWPEVEGNTFSYKDLEEIQVLRATTAFQNKNCALLLNNK